MPLQWVREISGGDINQAALIRSAGRNWFLKYHDNAPDGMFAAEMAALLEISKGDCIRVPRPIAHGRDDSTAWLVLEYLELTSDGPAAALGGQIAAMHQLSRDQYGWVRDNYIGSTPQLNTRSDHWAAFWRDRRLQPQLARAET